MGEDKKPAISTFTQQETEKLINEAFDSMTRDIEARRAKLLKRVRELLDTSEEASNTEARSIIVTDIRTQLQSLKGVSSLCKAKPMQISDEALTVLEEIHASRETRLRSYDTYNEGELLLMTRSEQAVIAVLAEAMLKGDDFVTLDELVERTGYSQHNIKTTLTSRGHLEDTRYQIESRSGTSWRMIR